MQYQTSLCQSNSKARTFWFGLFHVEDACFYKKVEDAAKL